MDDQSLAAVRLLADQSWHQLKELAGRPEFDFQSFEQIVLDHHLGNLAFAFLDEALLAELAPASFSKRLAKQRSWQTRKQESLWGQLVRIDEHLRDRRISFLLLKGFSFSARFFSDAMRRRQNDLDLLVKPSQYRDAVHTLSSLGFQADETVTPGPGGDCAIEMRSPSATIDLHIKLRNRPGYQIDYDRIWRSRRRIDIEGLPVSTLSDEYSLVLLLLSIAEDLGRGACRLKHFVDLYCLTTLAGEQFDWTAFFENRRQENLQPICTNVLEILRHLFPSPDRFTSLDDALRSSRCRWRTNRELALRLLHNPRPSLQNKVWLYCRTPAAVPERIKRLLVQPATVPEAMARKLNALRISLLSRGSCERLS